MSERVVFACCGGPDASVAIGRPVEKTGAEALDRDTAHFKRTAERRWGELGHDGLWSSPLENALDAFIETTREQVSGEVRTLLHGGRAAVDGRRGEEPPHHSALDTRDEGDTVDLLWDLPSKRDLTK
jgi:argininosuccinate synthase